MTTAQRGAAMTTVNDEQNYCEINNTDNAHAQRHRLFILLFFLLLLKQQKHTKSTDTSQSPARLLFLFVHFVHRCCCWFPIRNNSIQVMSMVRSKSMTKIPQKKDDSTHREREQKTCKTWTVSEVLEVQVLG